MVHSLFSKCFAYCRYTGVTLVSWILLKSEYFHDGQLSCTVMKTSPPLPLMKKFSYASKWHSVVLFETPLDVKFTELNGFFW